MNYQNDDLRINTINELLPPVALLEKFPATEKAAKTVSQSRQAIHQILKGQDDRLLVVIGPCSIHDPEAAKEYASRLLALRESLKDELEVVMRVYFEKPRTTVGWKGLINDPHMDNSFQINDHPAIPCRSDELGRHRRAYHRVSGAPRTGFRSFLPGRF